MVDSEDEKEGDGGTDDDSEDDLDAVRVTVKPADLGLGKLGPSWIWMTTSNSEDMSDPIMHAGKQYHCLALYARS